MNSLKVNGVQKIERGKSKAIYSCIATNEEVLGWKCKLSNTPSYFLDGLICIICKSIKESQGSDKNTIEITDPVIISKFDDTNSDGIQIIIFKVEDLPEILLNSFINSNKLSNMLEMESKNLSINSSKLITYSALKNLIYELFENNHFSNTFHIEALFRNYFEELIEKNYSFFPNTLSEVQNIKEKTIIHNLNSWYIYLRFLKEQLENGTELTVPDLSIKINYKGWSGIFFDRKNPLWEEIYRRSRFHYPSQKNKIKTYEYWKELTN
ncbi:ParB N-terminal domain-containing protein [Priestia megaterium]|uniref:hypothetical protein n=1 Tax=Priestia megaterium TaxID=1404 RepID=UPI002DBB4D2C|nr:hypothetical protein [Priestia megaterium]MEC1071404.1 hypothetical protein [Priestia megaterium]